MGEIADASEAFEEMLLQLHELHLATLRKRGMLVSMGASSRRAGEGQRWA